MTTTPQSEQEGSRLQGRSRHAHIIRKIQEAAQDGQHGSAAYAIDRLALIQALATTALQWLED